MEHETALPEDDNGGTQNQQKKRADNGGSRKRISVQTHRDELQEGEHNIPEQVHHIGFQREPPGFPDDERCNCDGQEKGRNHPGNGPAVHSGVPVEEQGDQHQKIQLNHNHFHDVIAKIRGNPQICPGDDGGQSKERAPGLRTCKIPDQQKRQFQKNQNKCADPEEGEIADLGLCKNRKRIFLRLALKLALT